MITTKLRELLLELEACPEAVEWAHDDDLKTAWNRCERGDWMLWLCAAMINKAGWPTHEQVVLVVCECEDITISHLRRSYQLQTSGHRLARLCSGDLVLSVTAAVESAINDAVKKTIWKSYADVCRKRLCVPDL